VRDNRLFAVRAPDSPEYTDTGVIAMPIRLSTIATAAVTAGFLGLAVFAGMATAADDESLSTTVVACCDYTDKSNCEDDGIY
jgi:hypothetical protein